MKPTREEATPNEMEPNILCLPYWSLFLPRIFNTPPSTKGPTGTPKNAKQMEVIVTSVIVNLFLSTSSSIGWTTTEMPMTLIIATVASVCTIHIIYPCVFVLSAIVAHNGQAIAEIKGAKQRY